MIRLRLDLSGRLQGVGFRPLVHRLAHEFGLAGSVCNTAKGVTVEIEGAPESVRGFVHCLQIRLPAPAFIRDRRERELAPTGESAFRILPSATAESAPTAEILPDLAMCTACSAEFSDPANRRFRYPFTNCTDCGPRYSIVRSLPFDRERTTMSAFTLCESCAGEYHDPMNRRFHAQAICCPACGPTLTLMDRSGDSLCHGEIALQRAIHAIQSGRIAAVLGVGGFHLVCDARMDAPISRLREFKRRLFKPFALMGADVNAVRRLCHVSSLEENLLSSPAAPIVLLDRREDLVESVSPWVAPQLATLGFMLPYSPLHSLLLQGLDGPIVATSGNRGEEPLCHVIQEGLTRLAGVADLFLVHDRPIAARVDDSVVRVIDGAETVLRAGRGYAPHVIEVETPGTPVLAFGGQQKNSLAFAREGRIVLLPHIGDLGTQAALNDYEQSLDHAISRHGLQSARAVCDLHPDYASTRIAMARDCAAIRVQHHEAHVLSCAAEHGVSGTALGVAWDGTGYGLDGTIWGGEFFLGSVSTGFRRVGHLRGFALPGAAAAVKEPRRVAFALGHELGLPPLCASAEEARVWAAMIQRSVNAPRCSSVGRFFDALAALLGLAPGRCDYEGQAAVRLETAAQEFSTAEPYPMPVNQSLVLDWGPCVHALLRDIQDGLKPAAIAAKVHATLAHAIVDVAGSIGAPDVLLSGGCFQNRRLSEAALAGLRRAGFRGHLNRRVPPGDGGVSVGQALGGTHVLVSPS